jgi:hypothetical protein
MAQTSALIAPVQPVLHQVSYSNETMPNAPKRYETQQYMSLGSNGVDKVHSLRIILMRLRGKNFSINCTSSAHFALSFVQLRSNPKCNQTQRNAAINDGPIEWVGCIHCEKFQNDFMAQTCALIAPVQPIFQRVSCSNETLPNAPKHYESRRNMSLGYNGVDRVLSLRKILMRLYGTNFCINCTSSAHFAPSFV